MVMHMQKSMVRSLGSKVGVETDERIADRGVSIISRVNAVGNKNKCGANLLNLLYVDYERTSPKWEELKSISSRFGVIFRRKSNSDSAIKISCRQPPSSFLVYKYNLTFVNVNIFIHQHMLTATNENKQRNNLN